MTEEAMGTAHHPTRGGKPFPCPKCGTGAFMGLGGDFCHECREYLADMGKGGEPKPKKPDAPAIPDDRSEKEIEWEITKTLRSLGWQVYKTSQPHQARGMTPGISDLIAFGFGLTAWLEIKTPTGRQSEAQALFEEVVVENGGLYEIIRSEAEAVEWSRQARERVA